MSIENVVVQIDVELDRLQRARMLLSPTVIRMPGRPPGTAHSAVVGGMSKEAREKISKAMKARWAKKTT